MSSSAELTKQIKAANDIVDVIAGYLPLQRAGKHFKCVCPFHDDHRPSMMVNKEFQSFKCWPCGAHGDIFTFVEKYEKVNFMEARALLAKRANIRIDVESPENDRRAQLFQVMQWAQQAFQNCYLESDLATEARKYIGERKMAGSLVRQFGIGFCPNQGDWLVQLANKQGISLEILDELGMVLKRDNGQGYFDRFRERVIFPIRDIQGRVIAFGGRILPSSYMAGRTGKYINSPDTPLFNKSHVIYGLDMARHSGTKDGYLAVVEGYTDVMMAHHHGCTSVVATMGTALTAFHVSQLRRYAAKVVLVYDADAGGISGVDRALELFVSQDVDLAIAQLPDSLDPADLLTRPNGAEEFRNCLTNAKDSLEFKLESLLKSNDTSIEGTRRKVDAVLSVLAAAPPVPSGKGQMKQELILNRLSHRLGISQKLVWGRFRELQTERRKAERVEAMREQRVRETQENQTGGSDADEEYGNNDEEPIYEGDAGQDEGQDSQSETGADSANEAEPETPKPVVETKPAATKPVSKPVNRKPDPLVRQLMELLMAEPSLAIHAKQKIPPDYVEHPDARRILDEIYFLVDKNIVADLDSLRVKLIDRPDLINIAMRLEQVGRMIPDRLQWFDMVVNGFNERKLKVEKLNMKSEIAAAMGDEEKQLQLLKELQNRSKRAS